MCATATAALELAQKAFRAGAESNPMVFRVLAAAYAETGQYPAAIQTAKDGAAPRRCIRAAGRRANVRRRSHALPAGHSPARFHAWPGPLRISLSASRLSICYSGGNFRSSHPMRSMTGYGRGESDRGGAKISVEVNSVNRKQSDIVINLPARTERARAARPPGGERAPRPRAHQCGRGLRAGRAERRAPSRSIAPSPVPITTACAHCKRNSASPARSRSA